MLFFETLDLSQLARMMVAAGAKVFTYYYQYGPACEDTVSPLLSIHGMSIIGTVCRPH